MFKSDTLRARMFNIYFGKMIPFLGNKLSKSKYAYDYLFRSVDTFYTLEFYFCLQKWIYT